MKYRVINSIFYWLGATACVFPIFIFDLHFLLELLLIATIYFLAGFIFISDISQAVIWVIGIIKILNMDFSVFTVIFFMVFLFWLVSEITWLIPLFKKK